MPELPEVETTRRGLEPLIVGRKIVATRIHQKQLRWEIPFHLPKTINGNKINSITRRAKYLLINLGNGSVVMHLGMSGSISVVQSSAKLKKHQHFEIELDNKTTMRLQDPRRFGAVLWQTQNETLKLLKNLGPEPLNDEFSVDTLYKFSRGKKQNIKTFIMDNANVVGVGNIYASESLFIAGISPKRASGNVSKIRYQKLTQSIIDVLTRAIEKGGTTLNDFKTVDGQPGYFSQSLSVYNRKDMPCKRCDGTIKKIIQNQRASYYCPKCQR